MMNIEDIQIVKQTRKHAICFCPNHKDTKTPNLYITLTGDYYGSYYCFACGYHGRLSERAMEDLDLKKKRRDKPVNIDWKQLVIDYYNWYWDKHYSGGIVLSDILDISMDSALEFLTGWDGTAFTTPMYNSSFDIIGIHRRFPNGKKCCVEGSQLGLFISCGYKQRCNETLFICEGFSDTVSVYDLGFFAIGKPSAQFGDDYILDFINQNKIEKVIIIPDNDKTEVGFKAAEKLAFLLVDKTFATTTIKSVRDDIKDIREYIKFKGKSFVQKELQLCV